LLDISKLESGAIKPDITDFHVTALFDELRAEFASLARSKGLQFSVEAPVESVHSDPSLVGQILRNLVANAIKYTQSGTVMLVCRRDADRICIDVRDSGIGIPAEQLRFIYDEFYQVGVGTNTSRDGYGLGLSIVHRLVKLLGLRIEVQSQVGVGSTFSLMLPQGATVIASDAPRAPRPTPAAQPKTQHHVLLVEDDPGVRNATRVFLKGEGYRVTATASLNEAIRCATETRDIDIIVSDYHLGGGGTGTEVIASVRKILNRVTAAVLVTGDTSTAMREVGRDTQLRITSKPINADEMLALIRELLAARV